MVRIQDRLKVLLNKTASNVVFSLAKPPTPTYSQTPTITYQYMDMNHLDTLQKECLAETKNINNNNILKYSFIQKSISKVEPIPTPTPTPEKK